MAVAMAAESYLPFSHSALLIAFPCLYHLIHSPSNCSVERIDSRPVQFVRVPICPGEKPVPIWKEDIASLFSQYFETIKLQRKLIEDTFESAFVHPTGKITIRAPDRWGKGDELNSVRKARQSPVLHAAVPQQGPGSDKKPLMLKGRGAF